MTIGDINHKRILNKIMEFRFKDENPRPYYEEEIFVNDN